MKILVVSTYEASGGAAIAASRLVKALRKNGAEVTMLVRKNIKYGGKRVRKQSWHSIIERVRILLYNRLSTRNLWAIDPAWEGEDITQYEEYRQADVIHLHWVNQGFLSLDTIEKITRSGKKVVWTMHDAWTTTGICHLTLSCDHYLRECGNCKYLHSPSPYDLSHQVWKKKSAVFSRKNIEFVTCSEWLMKEAKKSSLLSDQHVTTIPNPIDTTFFTPGDRDEAREILHVPKDRRLLLFVAQDIGNPNKGMKYLIDAMSMVKCNNITLVMLGGKAEESRKAFHVTELIALGYISDPYMIRYVYCACDAFVLPSLSENLPNTIMEAMACGTPSVAFGVGGIPEMITHGKNGYVAEYRNAADLSQGIEFVLCEENGGRLSSACREKAVREYGEQSVVDKYMSLYQPNNRSKGDSFHEQM